MSEFLPKLPQSEQLNIAALSGLFFKTTTSYKYLFFISILDILKRRNFEVDLHISFQEIIVEMLANAWYPYTYFKLSFGSVDKIAEKLDFLSSKLAITEPILQFKDTDKKVLRESIESQDLKKIFIDLKKCVPFRLIIPFLESELKLEKVNKGKGSELESKMPAIANRHFESQKPLYCFNSNEYKDCQSIILHPQWVEYIKTHYPIVRGWASWEWLNYMQQKNPSVPSIVNKIFIPQRRGSLSEQTKYWNLVVKYSTINCIYSGQPLTSKKLSLDHYLPWSFVAHDQLWNLVPTIPSINSAKSNKIPSEKYFDRFIQVQHSGLTISHAYFEERKWHRYIESYLLELKIHDKNSLLDVEVLSKAYHSTVIPLIALAENQGFTPNWSYETNQ